MASRVTPRTIKITPHINPYALGSVLVEFGNTKVHVTVSMEEKLPSWLNGKGQGWLSAEYSMLPSSTHTRSRRERKSVSGRTQEIQRLIGRSLRSIVDLKLLGEKSLMVDCDVLVADGGTRTTSITGAYVALELAVRRLMSEGKLQTSPITDSLGAISTGINRAGDIIVDLNYEEDSSCETDMNIVMTGSGKFVEVQGTAEGEPFEQKQLDEILSASKRGLEQVFAKQKEVLDLCLN